MKRLASLILAVLMASASAFAQGSLAPDIYPVFTNVNGTTPVALGFVCTTVSGTNDTLPTFQDVGVTVPNQNPIHLNSAGRNATGSTLLPIFLNPSFVYRFTLYSAGTGNNCNGSSVGAMIWQHDDISIPVGGGGGGGDISGSGSANILTKFTNTHTIGNTNITETGGLLNVNEAVGINGELTVQSNFAVAPFNTITLGAIVYTPPDAQCAGCFLQTDGSGVTQWVSAGTATTGGWTTSGATTYVTVTTSNVVVGSNGAGAYSGNTSFLAKNGKLVAEYNAGVGASSTFEISDDVTSVKLNTRTYSGTTKPIDIQADSGTLGRIQTDGTFSWGTTTDSAFKMDVNGSTRVTGELAVGSAATSGTTTGLYVKDSNLVVARFEASNLSLGELSLDTPSGNSGGMAWSNTVIQLTNSDGSGTFNILGNGAGSCAAGHSCIELNAGGLNGLDGFWFMGTVAAASVGTPYASTSYYIFIDSADGHKLKVKGASGTVTTLASP